MSGVGIGRRINSTDKELAMRVKVIVGGGKESEREGEERGKRKGESEERQ